MTIPILAIVADDLTGALDAAAPFASDTTRVVVATRPEALSEAVSSGADVVAVSTRSREISADKAKATVKAVLADLPPGMRIVKKIDSRLKGNVAAELEAFGEKPLVVLPALPGFGRIVRNGKVEGFGVDQPVPVSSVLGASSTRAQIPDTDSQAAIEAALAAAPEEAILVGARGLALALARSMGVMGAGKALGLEGPICFVVGSTDPITLVQVAALKAALPDMAHIPAASGEVPAHESNAPVTLLQATEGAETRADIIAKTFARTAAPQMKKARSVVMTGGATAEAMLDALGVTRLEVIGEALPGMPISRSGGQIFVTKSGGFGAPDTFVRLAEATVKAEAG